MTTATTIDSYIQESPKEIQVILNKVRETILEVEPQLKEAIKWGMPTFVLHGNVVHFATHKNHLGFYPGDTGIAAFEKELEVYKSSKGAVQFLYKEEIPYDLITKIVKYRVNENRILAESKKRKNKNI